MFVYMDGYWTIEEGIEVPACVNDIGLLLLEERYRLIVEGYHKRVLRDLCGKFMVMGIMYGDAEVFDGRMGSVQCRRVEDVDDRFVYLDNGTVELGYLILVDYIAAYKLML